MPMLGDIKLHQCDIPIAFKVNAPGASRYIDERLKNQKFLQCTKCGPWAPVQLDFSSMHLEPRGTSMKSISSLKKTKVHR